MRFGLLIGLNSRGNPNDGGWKEMLEKARVAESLGIEFLSTGEAWGPSSIPWLTAVALNTSKAMIGTSISMSIPVPPPPWPRILPCSTTSRRAVWFWDWGHPGRM